MSARIAFDSNTLNQGRERELTSVIGHFFDQGFRVLEGLLVLLVVVHGLRVVKRGGDAYQHLVEEVFVFVVEASRG